MYRYLRYNYIDLLSNLEVITSLQVIVTSIGPNCSQSEETIVHTITLVNFLFWAKNILNYQKLAININSLLTTIP